MAGVRERVEAVEARSTQFRRELGLATLVLTQVMYVVGSGWVGTAAKLGDSHVVFWLLAIFLYYLPQAAVVIYLNRLMPLEGGLFQWATVGLGPALASSAWNLWACAVVIMAVFGVMIATNLSYLLSALGATFMQAGWYTPVVSSAAVIFVTVVALLGLRVGKWLQGLGGAAQILMFSALIAVPFIAMARERAVDYHPLSIAMPAVSLLSLNIFGKMALGALSGFEYVAILAGECRDPARSIRRCSRRRAGHRGDVHLRHGSVLSLVDRDRSIWSRPSRRRCRSASADSPSASIVPVLILLLLGRQIGSHADLCGQRGTDGGGLGPAGARVVLAPAPALSHAGQLDLFVGSITLVLNLAGQIGVGLRRRFSCSGAPPASCMALRTGALCDPLFGAARRGVQPPFWLKAACASGFASRRSAACSRSSRSSTSPAGPRSPSRSSRFVAANLIGWAIYRTRGRSGQPRSIVAKPSFSSASL
jgi:hypothetical protein